MRVFLVTRIKVSSKRILTQAYFGLVFESTFRLFNGRNPTDSSEPVKERNTRREMTQPISVLEETDLQAGGSHDRQTPRNESTAQPSWADIVDRIRRDEPSGMEELYKVFRKGVRFFLLRQFGVRDLDDKVHDIFVIVLTAIKRGDLREPERLMGFVRTVIRRQAAAHIEQIKQERRQQADLDDVIPFVQDEQKDPEHEAIDKEKTEIAARVLRSLCTRDREVLIRFYVKGHRPETIWAEMGLTPTQFRLIKSRAKGRYTELCQARFSMVRRKPVQGTSQLVGYMPQRLSA
jgi:RNA polymerase sigma-70 factor, ECF subfamily